MLTGLLRAAGRPGCATRPNLSVAAYCLAFGDSLEESVEEPDAE